MKTANVKVTGRVPYTYILVRTGASAAGVSGSMERSRFTYLPSTGFQDHIVLNVRSLGTHVRLKCCNPAEITGLATRRSGMVRKLHGS